MDSHHNLPSVNAMKTAIRVLTRCSCSIIIGLSPYIATASTTADDYSTTPVNVVTIDNGKSVTLRMATHLRNVFEIGSEIGLPETLQAILLIETNGGESERVGSKHAPYTLRSYGLMQLQIGSARSILERNSNLLEQYFPERTYRSISNKEIVSLLLTNDEANVTIAAYLLKLYLHLSKGNWSKAVAAYNMGIGNALKITNHGEVEYVRRVKQKLNTTVRIFNRNNELTYPQ